MDKLNIKLQKDGLLKQSPRNETRTDFVFTNGTSNKYQNHPPVLNDPEYHPVLFFNVCDDPSEINNLVSVKEKAAEVNELYKILLKETLKAPPQFAGDAASRIAGQSITIIRDNGVELVIDLPLDKDSIKKGEDYCTLKHMPFIPDDLTITELARVYDKGYWFRTLPDKLKKLNI